MKFSIILTTVILSGTPAFATDCSNMTICGTVWTSTIESKTWHLLTKSHGGTVSLLSKLTKEECEYSKNRLLGLPATEEERKAKVEELNRRFPSPCPKKDDDWKKWHKEHPDAIGCASKDGSYTAGAVHITSNSDIDLAECFQ